MNPTPLLDQIRVYSEALVDDLPEPTPPRVGRHESGRDLMVFDLGEPDESQTPTPWSRRAVVAASAAAVVMLVVGFVLADRDGGIVDTDAASSPSVVEPVAPSGVADPDSSLWSPDFHDEAVFGGDGESGMSGVVAGGPGFVAVGSRDGNAVVWTSVDGLTWSRVSHDEAVFGGDGESGMSGVVAGGPGLVAVGWQVMCTDHEVLDEEGSPRVDEDGNLEPDTVCVDGNAVVWTSVDGLTWSRVTHDEAVFGGRRFYGMSSVTLGGPGLVAVGRSDAFGEGDPFNEGEVNEGDATVWTSVDGLAWSRVAHDEAVFGGDETQEMLDVTAGGPGLVAVGRDGAGGAWDNPILARGGQHPAVWTSVDGITWTRAAHDEDAFGGSSSAMLGVTTGGPGLVAVGYRVFGPPPVWTSVDGLTWSQVTHENGTEMSGIMVGVTTGGPGLVAFGMAVWTSPDGLTWSLAANVVAEPAIEGSSWVWGLTSTNGHLVAVGSHNPNRDSQGAAVWTSPDP
jgi:hypothetical protein